MCPRIHGDRSPAVAGSQPNDTRRQPQCGRLIENIDDTPTVSESA
jgi:hypothetical protein